VAAAALGSVGPQGQAAFPALLEVANSTTDAFLRGIARASLLDIDRAAADKAGVREAFLFCSSQPTLRRAFPGCAHHSHLGVVADGKVLLALGAEDETVAVYDADTGEERALLQGCPLVVWHVAFSADGKLVAVAGEDQAVRLWELATGKHLATLRGHTEHIGA